MNKAILMGRLTGEAQPPQAAWSLRAKKFRFERKGEHHERLHPLQEARPDGAEGNRECDAGDKA